MYINEIKNVCVCEAQKPQLQQSLKLVIFSIKVMVKVTDLGVI